jgi:hypothetical protein
MITVFDTLGSWTIDEQAVRRRRQEQQQEKQPESAAAPPVYPQTDQAWVAFMRAILEAISPYREAYQTALAVVRQTLARLETEEHAAGSFVS